MIGGYRQSCWTKNTYISGRLAKTAQDLPADSTLLHYLTITGSYDYIGGNTRGLTRRCYDLLTSLPIPLGTSRPFIYEIESEHWRRGPSLYDCADTPPKYLSSTRTLGTSRPFIYELCMIATRTSERIHAMVSEAWLGETLCTCMLALLRVS